MKALAFATIKRQVNLLGCESTQDVEKPPSSVQLQDCPSSSGRYLQIHNLCTADIYFKMCINIFQFLFPNIVHESEFIGRANKKSY